MRAKAVIDGQQVEIPVLRIFRTVGTQEDRKTQERKYWVKHKDKDGRKNPRLMLKCDEERRIVAKFLNPHCQENPL